MAFLVKLIAFTNDDPSLGDRVNEVISKGGGTVRESEFKKTSSDSSECYVCFLIDQVASLSGIVGSVERIRGVGVMAVTEPVETPDTRLG